MNRVFPRVEVRSRAELRIWLAENHRSGTSHWLVTGKKSAGDSYLPYNEIVEELLAFGWIDSLPRALDSTRSMLLISPRKPGSNWSLDNRERIDRLLKQGRMDESGIAVVERAKKDGSWQRLMQTETGVAPIDLQEALVSAGAIDNWNALSFSQRRRALELLLAAKRPETRAARIGRIVEACENAADPTAWKPSER